MPLLADERPREGFEAPAGRDGGGGAARKGRQAQGAARARGPSRDARDHHARVQQPAEQAQVRGPRSSPRTYLTTEQWVCLKPTQW